MASASKSLDEGYLNTPRTSRIISGAVRTLEKLGLKGSMVERAGAGDSRYFSPECVETIDFGPDEYVEMWGLGRVGAFYIGIRF